MAFTAIEWRGSCRRSPRPRLRKGCVRGFRSAGGPSRSGTGHCCCSAVFPFRSERTALRGFPGFCCAQDDRHRAVRRRKARSGRVVPCALTCGQPAHFHGGRRPRDLAVRENMRRGPPAPCCQFAKLRAMLKGYDLARPLAEPNSSLLLRNRSAEIHSTPSASANWTNGRSCDPPSDKSRPKSRPTARYPSRRSASFAMRPLTPQASFG